MCSANEYASATVQFAGAPSFGDTTELLLDGTAISHLNLIGDTAASIATCFVLLINEGSTAVWAAANGTTVTITARAPGSAGNSLSHAEAQPGRTGLDEQLSDGAAGIWDHTDRLFQHGIGER